MVHRLAVGMGSYEVSDILRLLFIYDSLLPYKISDTLKN